MSLILEILKLVTAVLGLVKAALEVVHSLRSKKGGDKTPVKENDTQAR